MWPYKTRGSRFMGDIQEIAPSRLAARTFRANDSAIKLWLPDKLLAAIDVLCDVHDTSRPDVLRALLFGHAFGYVELAHLIRRASEPSPDRQDVLFSARRSQRADWPRREINAHYLGKATEDVKLFIPADLKAELAYLAEQAQKPLKASTGSEVLRCHGLKYHIASA